MGGDFMTPKAIANRIKAKGLQKLRWYCQMCEKQCRDENGFKCHCTSESHLRQMALFSESSDSYLNNHSKDFSNEFMKLLSRRYGTRRVHANLVYQEYISDREHIHMNATHWTSLTDFVKHLGKEGLCEVDETEKGWFIKWVDRSPATLAKQEAILKKERLEKTDEERAQKELEDQIRRAQEESGKELVNQASELKRTTSSEPIKLQLKPATTTNTSTTTGGGFAMKKPEMRKVNPLKSLSSLAKVKAADSAPASPMTLPSSTSTIAQPKKLSAVEQIIQDEMSRKRKFTGPGRVGVSGAGVGDFKRRR
ncbi:domain of Kin17 curved DNA-binding protein-domain-containing protein [Fimicolochytrium jonesii]|uniref:domain of Kin17 curved DNA-binding protein-domain-containing protein n=1 Tax=Fimicolochytrium jonesii TaxID=1396493 RepID=UPI0022FDDDEA|nr:domain of Kin17 curved DNA-binding protein-domain-containing protein [Fimicolochytrium jonesii]KAI8815779.1 domain of Kin17 curved DNA-binding protein-domain-containing protein [Fimicolochytrium jonesii]